MNRNTEAIVRMYDNFGKGDIPAILAQLSDDVVWSFEANDKISWGGIRRGPAETLGFFQGIADQLSDPFLEMTEFLADEDRVASFGRFEATVRATGRRVSTPVAHYFRFRDGKVCEYRNHINTAAFSDALTA